MQDAGIELPGVTDKLVCTHLKGGRCSIYEHRPLICRLFGATTDLRCGHGCRPEHGFIDDEVAQRLMQRTRELMAGSTHVPGFEP